MKIRVLSAFILVSLTTAVWMYGCKKKEKESSNSDYAGTWNVNETCTSAWTYVMSIATSGSDGVTLTNFHKGSFASGFTINATVSDKTLTIASQQASSVNQGGPYTFAGSGTFTPPSSLSITYTMRDASGATINCTANGTK